MSTELTTIQIDTKARDRLREIASFYKRSMAGQIEWMIDQEYEDLAAEWGASPKNNKPIPKGQIELPIKE